MVIEGQYDGDHSQPSLFRKKKEVTASDNHAHTVTWAEIQGKPSIPNPEDFETPPDFAAGKWTFENIAVGDQASVDDEIVVRLQSNTELHTWSIYQEGNVPSYFDGTVSSGQSTAGTNSEAFGSGAVASGDNATVLGNGSSATGNDSIVIGYNSTDNDGSPNNDMVIIGNDITGGEVGSTLIGSNITYGRNRAAVLGTNLSGTGNRNVLIGSGVVGENDDVIGIGGWSVHVTGAGSIAIGRESDARHGYSIAFGRMATTTQANEMMIGGVGYEIDYLQFVVSATYLTWTNSVQVIGNISARPSGTGTNSEAFGYDAIATGTYATVLGNGSSADGLRHTVVGYNNVISGGDSVVVGTNISDSGYRKILIGDGVSSSGNNTIVIGESASSSGSYSIAIGQGSHAYGGGIAIGGGADATSGYSGNKIAIGRDASVGSPRNNAFCFGRNSTTSQDGEVSFGAASYEIDYLRFVVSGTYLTWNNNVTIVGMISAGQDTAGTSSEAFGAGASATGNQSVALGNGATASYDWSVVIGRGASDSQVGAVAIGDQSSAGLQAVAVGKDNGAANYSVAIGHQSFAVYSPSIALGKGAVTTQANEMMVGGTSYEIDYLQYIVSGTYLTWSNSVLITGNISCVPTGSDSSSEAFGDGASATGGNSTVVGRNASCSGTEGIAVGYSANNNAGNYSIVVGQESSMQGDYSITMGYGATNGAYDSCITIGAGASTSYAESIAIGRAAQTTQANEMVVGGTSYEIDYLMFTTSGDELTFRNSLIFDQESIYMGSTPGNAAAYPNAILINHWSSADGSVRFIRNYNKINGGTRTSYDALRGISNDNTLDDSGATGSNKFNSYYNFENTGYLTRGEVQSDFVGIRNYTALGGGVVGADMYGISNDAYASTGTISGDFFVSFVYGRMGASITLTGTSYLHYIEDGKDGTDFDWAYYCASDTPSYFGGNVIMGAAKDLDCVTNGAYLKPRRVSASAEPTPDTDEFMIWRDPDDNKTYLIYNDTDEGSRKVEIT